MNSQELIATIRAAQSVELEQLALRYQDDPRLGVQRAIRQALQRQLDQHKEEARCAKLYKSLDELGNNSLVVGIDEVGRGSLAGPLVVAAVILPPKPRILGLNDSKQLKPVQRQKLSEQIKALAISVQLAWIDAQEIDRLGMTACLKKAMRQVLEDCGLQPDLVLIDGHPVGIHPKEQCIIHGDALEAPIAAASIVAKVSRDHWMVEAAKKHPGYGWEDNKGYGSAEHIQALRDLGPTGLHRLSFLHGILDKSPATGKAAGHKVDPSQESLF